MNEIFKKCSGCKEELPLSSFHSNKARKDCKCNYCKGCIKIIGKKREPTLSRKFYRYKKSAKDRGLSFEFIKEDFKKFIDNNCFYCGEKIIGIGIDRRNNSIGYTKENSLSCCKMCNKMKNNSSEIDFINRCKAIVNNYK